MVRRHALPADEDRPRHRQYHVGTTIIMVPTTMPMMMIASGGSGYAASARLPDEFSLDEMLK
ncbi:hypothetical protein QY049_20475 [Bradyrhizobium sp. WYCCWR 13022]|uniref:hypothetical protein n=1 Tax=unclassified Bradyrhizobium TaxID=2631580 RepID=UPI00263B9647|nr:hypothetical protein [Bradyrhizobium sp. WYCCWR 13022]MDN4985543.1 hypothetical protein [Bradyrhizobium sp. WYCCWR 13022]